ncbi:putative toxin-antitoxin system toxin component, PIN family [Flavisolibacter ginsenosidimutans]|uniref:Putative toxin-antitoxin system toxin component, PIN family n=1 Tax=Flavisolibacter ginsenosidimutans TaxID=661481 RepID=A0A5B8UJV0_9BACT|nr:putative toxin-antitoxin system toxin component, PIN family [Flavisolibacter ginsenosidimutans]QEC56429.1 putative toxin-antitoxin system toxin component, PIN family [Flavisolibacter ginsenosidimutans]
MRLILDTNVLVSALIQRNYPHFIVDQILADSHLQLCLSEPLFTEYVKVLNREKFSRFPDFHFRAQTLLADVENSALKFSPTVGLNIISDPADNRLLELAETCQADYLITGNTNDFTMSEYKGTKIVSPKEMFDLLTK